MKLLSKRAVSPVVATALLLVVAVSAVVGFSSWINEFNSNLFVDVESDSSSSSSVRVEGIFNDVLYLKSSSDVDLSSLLVYSSNGSLACDFSSEVEVSNDGLVGHWDFSNTGDGIIHDLSGNGNDGKLYGDTNLLLDFDDGTASDRTSYNNSGVVNGATWTNSDCVSGGCYEFDNTNLNKIEIININQTIFDNDFTVSLWFKVNNFNSSASDDITNIIGNRDYLSQGQGWVIRFPGENANKIRFYTSNESVNPVPVLDMNFNFSVDVWYNILISKKGNNSKGYINGDYISELNSYENLSSVRNYLRIGRINSTVRSFNGSIDEVAIYSKALSSVEVLDVYNSQKVGFVEFSEDGLEFDGIDDYVEISDSDTFTLRSNYTFFSILSQDGIVANYADILTKWDCSVDCGESSWWFGVVNLIEYNLVRGILINDSGSPTLHEYNYINSEIFKNNKFEIVFNTFNGTHALGYNNLLKIEESITNFTSIHESNKTVFIGKSHHNLDPINGFKGTMSEIRLYNRTLSKKELELFYFDLTSSSVKGINKIDLSSCNLNSNEKYNVLVGGDNGLIDVEVIPQ